MFIVSDQRQMSLALMGIDRATGRWWLPPMKPDSRPVHSRSKTNLILLRLGFELAASVATNISLR
jgi:hypothetical protein